MEIQPFGMSFAPTSQNDQDRLGQESAAQNVQEAVRVLSLRLPRFLGAQAPAPLDLLKRSPAAPSGPVDAIVAEILKRVLPGQPGAPGAPGAGAGPLQAPPTSAWQQPVFSYPAPPPPTAQPAYVPPAAPPEAGGFGGFPRPDRQRYA